MPGGLVAIFSRSFGKSKRKGPYASLRLEAEAVREIPDGPLVAVHVAHEWHVDGEKFWRLDFEPAVKVHFLDDIKSKAYGPFDAFSAVNKVAFRERHVFAFVDADVGHWYCHDDGRHWPLMVIEAAN